MLQVRFLGQYDIRLDGQPVIIPSRPAQSLLAYLLLHPDNLHRREKLAGQFLPRMLTGKAKEDRFQGTVSLIRSMDSAGPRISFLMHSLFIPTPVDWRSIKLPPLLYPLYCLIRPLRLFFKLLARVVKTSI